MTVGVGGGRGVGPGHPNRNGSTQPPQSADHFESCITGPSGPSTLPPTCHPHFCKGPARHPVAPPPPPPLLRRSSAPSLPPPPPPSPSRRRAACHARRTRGCTGPIRIAPSHGCGCTGAMRSGRRPAWSRGGGPFRPEPTPHTRSFIDWSAGGGGQPLYPGIGPGI